MDKLDHPIVFLFVLALFMLAAIKIMHWGAMKASQSTNNGFSNVGKSLAAFTSLPG